MAITPLDGIADFFDEDWQSSLSFRMDVMKQQHTMPFNQHQRNHAVDDVIDMNTAVPVLRIKVP